MEINISSLFIFMSNSTKAFCNAVPMTLKNENKKTPAKTIRVIFHIIASLQKNRDPNFLYY